METWDQPSTKYQKVFEALYKDITTGLYAVGQKLPSEAELVHRFGTSRITVGRAVRELQQRKLVERKAGSGTYVLGNHSDGLTFGLLVPDFGRSEIFEPICQGMAEASQNVRHLLLWGQGTTTPDNDRSQQAWSLCEQYIERRVAGVFFAPLEFQASRDVNNERIISALKKARIPVVLIDRDYRPYPERSPYDLVGIDNRRTGYRITEHLLKQGARRVAFASYPSPVSTVDERRAGYREALYAAGLPIHAEHSFILNPEEPAELRSRLSALDVDAFVCANDPTAGHLMHGLLSLGRRIPQDVRIAGIDDVHYASLLPVPLTTMHQPCREIGMAAMSLMLERLARPDMPVRDVLLECPLVVRQSCGALLK